MSRGRGGAWITTAAALGWTLAASAQSFEEVAAAVGVDFQHQASKTSRKYLIETMGAGAAVFDHDGDGLLDLFFVNGAALSDPMPAGATADKSAPRFWNRLYRNRGDGRFEDAAERAGVAGSGYGMGAAVGDYDNDGDLDLFVSNFGADLLYRNEGDGRFIDRTAEAGVGGGEAWSSGAVFFDFDGDGLLDLFAARYLEWEYSLNRACGPLAPRRRSYCHPRLFRPARHALYRNLGDGRFEDVSEAVGLHQHPGKGLGVALGDFDDDGRLDVFVANDSHPQQLFRNVEGRRFEEVAVAAGVAYDADGGVYAGMGVAWADVDGDGRDDLLVNALGRQGYWLYRNSGGRFETASERSGLATLSALRSGWGVGLEDFDNDGFRDLFVAQGHVMDDIEESDPALAFQEPLMLARNLFGRFYDVAERTGEVFQRRFAGRGAAFGDFDDDGRLDIAVNVNDGPALLLRNTSREAGATLTVRLRGTRSNRDAVGAKVIAETTDGRTLSAKRSFAGGYLSSSAGDPRFGLGDAECARLSVIWPGGRRQEITPCRGPVVEIVEP